MEPLYLVTGLHRSGTSMMMGCLKEGGLNPIYDLASENMNNTIGDYVPNPNGFYQFTEEIDKNFYTKYKGNLIKCPLTKVLKLPEGNYKIVLLQRNPSEIRESMHKWTPYMFLGTGEIISYMYDEYMSLIISELEKRKDCDVVILNYNNIISNPKKEFKKLTDSGWRIDIKKLVDKVDLNLYRNKAL